MAMCVLLALLAGCAQEPRTGRHAFFALGTLVEISVYDPPEDFDEILRDVEARLLEQEHRWRAWGDGTLANINERLAAGDAVALDAAMLAGIERARDIAQRSGGRFNPAIGRMIETWGFNVEERDAGPPPADSELATLLPPPTLLALEQTGDGLWRSADSRLWIDMGAFAKGLAVETAIAALRGHGIENAVVNAGGDLKVIGQHGARPWRIGVRDPRGDGVLAAVDASGNESVFTSGDYERFFEWEGVRYHHIIDPATARPARGVTSVTVIHSDAALADAAATALFVAGPGEWRATARALGVDKVMIVLENGRVEMTPEMEERVEFVDSAPHAEIPAP
ncbi:MAG TPA: FAD:protein FMN transferase [Gammaproteobacteria bacterium]